MSGNGLAKCPYIFREQYDIGDTITVAFSGKSAKAQILSITEHWSWANYDISFSFGKPQNNLSDQLQLMLRKIQEASNKTNSTDSVRWYTISTDTAMSKADVTYNTIGFVGTCASGGSTFTLYLDNEKTGAKTYHVYFKQLGGGTLTLTTGKAGASNLTLNSGTYVAIIYVDENGNVTTQGTTVVNSVTVDNMQSVSSNAVAEALTGAPTQTLYNDTNVAIRLRTLGKLALFTVYAKTSGTRNYTVPDIRFENDYGFASLLTAGGQATGEIYFNSVKNLVVSCSSSGVGQIVAFLT
jgi:hypothetical protein